MNKYNLNVYQTKIRTFLILLLLLVNFSTTGYSAQATNTGKKDWYETSKYPNGQLKWQCKYQNKVKKWCKNYFETGDIESEQIFSNANGNGTWKAYFKTGKLRAECDLKNGKLEGIYRRYYIDGRLAEEIRIKNGAGNGAQKTYSETDDLRGEFTIINGKREGAARVFENDQLAVIANFKNDLPEGIQKEFEFGKLTKETSFSNGVLNGLTSFYSNGTLKLTEFYKDGVKQWAKSYGDNGAVDKEWTFKKAAVTDEKYPYNQTQNLTPFQQKAQNYLLNKMLLMSYYHVVDIKTRD